MSVCKCLFLREHKVSSTDCPVHDNRVSRNKKESEKMSTTLTQHRLIPVTDTRGKFLLGMDEMPTEPEPDSILMTNGVHGTAWQRHASDGLWHSTLGGRPKPWLEIIKSRNVVLVYDAPARRGAVQ